MIDVAEDGDDGRTGHQLARFGAGVLKLRFKLLFHGCGSDHLELDAVFKRQGLGHGGLQGLIDVGHHTLLHELGDDLVALDTQRGGKPLDGNRLLDLDGLTLLHDALGLRVMRALGALQMAVEAGAITGRVAQANAPLFQVGLGIFLEFFHRLAAAAIGTATARGKRSAALAAALFLVGVLAFFVGRLDPPAALGACLDKCRWHCRL